MIIYRFPRSRSLKVLWTLEELGVSYDSVKVDLLTANKNSESPHPFGKVPYLVDGDISIGETLAICIFICEKYRGESLYPSDPLEKSLVNTWVSFAITDLESCVWGLLKQLLFISEDKRNSAIVSNLRDEVSKAIAQIKIDPHKKWIASDTFSLADIFMSQTLQWAKYCGVDLGEPINTYLEKTINRRSYQVATERNDA